jgi:phosphoribosylamine-glycine ligase
LHIRFRKGTVRQPPRPQQKEAACAAGRALGVTALGPDFGGAREHAYTAVDRIGSPEGFCRRDIAAPR